MNRVALVSVLWCTAAHAASGSFRAEPSVTFSLSEPQATYFTPGGNLTLSGQIDVFSWLGAFAQIGGLILPPRSGAPVLGPGSAFFLGLGLRAQRPRTGNTVVPWLDVALDYVNTGGLNRLLFAGGVGLLFSLFDRFWLGPHARYLHVFKLVDDPGFFNADAAMVSVGLTLEYDLVPAVVPPADTDGDGLIEERDRFPTTPAHTPDGCPDVDSDGDSIVDRVDKCPREKGIARLDGCPDPDPDGDGIVSSLDRCPDQAEDLDGFQDDDGCPEADNDGDGVPDTTDTCPMEPGGAATQGCPDSDGDEVADRVDNCVSVPGPKENAGCPLYKQVVVTEVKIEIKQKIFFAFGKATILPKSFGLMNEVVQAMKDHDKLCVRIEGHTDSKGARKVNLKLSDDRAKSVMKYLSDHQVPAGRMTSVGYGPDHPLDDNKTTEGREKNRRVEFVIVPCAEGGK